MELPAWPAWRLDPAGPDGAHVSWDLRVALNPAAANPAMRAERESLGGRREGARVAPGAHQGILAAGGGGAPLRQAGPIWLCRTSFLRVRFTRRARRAVAEWMLSVAYMYMSCSGMSTQYIPFACVNEKQIAAIAGSG